MPLHALSVPDHLRRCIRNAVRACLDTLLPGSCVLCGHPSPSAVCPRCHPLLPGMASHRCRICAVTLSEPFASCCGSCLAQPPAFDATIVALDYAAPADLLIRDLKFRARLALAPVFSDLLVQALQSSPSLRGDLLIPVPLSPARLATRGFNQSMEIARLLAPPLALPLEASACVRVRETAPQSGLPFAQRQGNMRGAFAVRHRRAVQQRQVMVVDDVMTTGHTLNELARCLKRHGATRVINLVVARTPRH